MKRARSDTITSAVKAMQNAGKGPIAVPAHVVMREEDKPFWIGIVRSRARDDWTDADLVVAAQLARVQADIEGESILLGAEESVILNARGTQIVNPRHSVLMQLRHSQMALMRTLRMGGRVSGDARDDVGNRKIENQADRARQEILGEEDSLLAG